MESVLLVAVQLFTERGYEATSMEDLAQRLGVSKSAIYHHVTSKEDLLRHAVDRALDGLFEVIRAVEAMPGSAVERLEFLVAESVRVLARQLPFVTLLVRLRGNTEVERDALRRRREFDRFTAALVAEAVRQGDVRPDVDPVIAARLLFGLVNSLVDWYRPDRDTGDALPGTVTAIAFDGLRSRVGTPGVPDGCRTAVSDDIIGS